MGAFKLGNMTFGSLFKKPETVLYPTQQKPQPAGLKGHIGINVQDCILCSMCERSCPTSCITVDKADSYWQIDRFSCIQCGYCTTVCPKDCLSMQPGYAPASTVHTALRYDVPKQEKPKKKADSKPAAKPEVAKDQATPSAEAPAVDRELEAKLAMMDEQKAAKVRAAMAAK